jgi:glutathione S-transferase
MLIDWAKDDGCGKYRENTAAWANRRLSELERWLDRREYVAIDDFTVADILMSHVLDAIKDPELTALHPRVTSYRDRCLARPAWKRTIDKYLARVQTAQPPGA